MTLTISAVGTRRAVAQVLRKTQKDKDFGLITDVKVTKVSLFTWHISFDVEVKSL